MLCDAVLCWLQVAVPLTASCQHLHCVSFSAMLCCAALRCLQVAVDFVTPESMGQALAMKARLRAADLVMPQPLDEGPHDRQCQEKLQSQLILLRGVMRAAQAMQTAQ